MKLRFVLFVMPLLCGAASCFAQCSASIQLIPDKTAHMHAPAGAHLEEREFVRYRYALGDGALLDVIAVADDSPFGGYMDRGLLVEKDGRTTQATRLKDFAVLKPRGEDVRMDFDPSDSFRALAMVRSCVASAALQIVTFQWMGDMTSADLFVTVIRNGTGYTITALPTVSGGVLDVSRSHGDVLRTWDNLFEGECNACLTRYRVREYALREGKPVAVRSWVTRRKYSSDDAIFPPSRARIVR